MFRSDYWNTLTGLMFNSSCLVDSVRKLGDGNLILYWTGLTAELIKICLKIAFRRRLGKGVPLKQCHCSNEFIFIPEIATFIQFGLMKSDMMLLSG